MDGACFQRDKVEQLAEEFVERYRRGEHPSLTEYTERYPEYAEQIRDLFPALIMMEQVAPDSTSDPASSFELHMLRPAAEQLGDYRILREIGRGGMGIVYEAEQVSLGRRVALKVLIQPLLPQDKHRERFEREARAAARLHHTNIVPVFGVGEESGLHYYVMQYIHGLGLDAVLEELRRLQQDNGLVSGAAGPRAGCLELSAENVARALLTGLFEQPRSAPADGAADDTTDVPFSKSGSLSASSMVLPGQSGEGHHSKPATYWQSVAHVGVQVAGALAYAHQQGILHRDIKPANLLLDTQGTVWITDFGLAKVEGQQHLTHTGDVVGTLRYLAPEVFNSKADVRSEVYALGLTLYEMLALRPAFDEKDRHRLIRQLATCEPPPLDKVNRRIPRDLVTIVHKAIDREPRHRYQSAQEVAEDLRRYLAGEPIRARPSGIWERGIKWARRRPAMAALVTVTGIALLGLLAGTLWHNAKLTAALRDRDTSLYDSLVEEAEAIRRARGSGYRAKVFERLTRALQLDTPHQDRLELRQQAAACLGDFVGLGPVTWEDFSTTITIETAALHPSGTMLALGLADGAVLLRSIPSGAPITRLIGHRTAVSWLGFRADGKELVSTDLDGTINVWQPDDTGAWTSKKTIHIEAAVVFMMPSLVFPFLTPTFQTRPIHAADLTPEGRFLVVSCITDSTIVMVDLADGTTAARFSAPRGERFLNLGLSPDGKLLAGGYIDKPKFGVFVWEVATRRLMKRLEPNLEVSFDVRFSPDSKLLACLHSEGIALYDTSTLEHAQIVRGDQPLTIAFSPDGETLAINVEHLGIIRLWDVNTNREMASLNYFRSGLPYKEFAKTWRSGPRFMTFMGLSKDGKRLVVATEEYVRIWDLAGASEKLVLEGKVGGVPDVVFSPDGKLLAWAGKDHTTRISDPVTGKLVKTLRGSSNPIQSLCFSADGRILAVGDWEEDTIRLYEVPSWNVLDVKKAEVGSPVASIAFSPDGQYLVAGGWRGLTLWRAVPGNPGRRIQYLSRLVEYPCASVYFSADGNWLAWVGWHEREGKSWYHQIHISNLRSTQLRDLPLGITGSGIFALGLYPDSKHLAFVSDKLEISVWDMTTQREVFPFGKGELEQRGALRGATRLSPDGTLYAIGKRAVTIWDMVGRKLLVELPGERSAVESLGWSPNGELLAVGTRSGVVIWNLPKINAKLAELGLDW